MSQESNSMKNHVDHIVQAMSKVVREMKVICDNVNSLMELCRPAIEQYVKLHCARRSDDCEDVVQEAYQKLWGTILRKMGLFQQATNSAANADDAEIAIAKLLADLQSAADGFQQFCPSDGQFKSYLKRVATSVFDDLVRKPTLLTAPLPEGSADINLQAPGPTPSSVVRRAESAVRRADSAKNMERTINEIAKDVGERMALRLSIIEELDYTEIVDLQCGKNVLSPQERKREAARLGRRLEYLRAQVALAIAIDQPPKREE